MRLSKNFSFVKNEKILELVQKLENRFKNRDYEPMPALARKIVEAVFIEIFQFDESNLHENILRYKETYDQPIVVDALYQIKKWGNNHLHYSSNPEPFTFTNALYILKSVSIFLQDAYLEASNFQFTETPYLETNILNEVNKEKETIASINEKELKISKTSFINWFKKDHIIFKIPFYQRNYTWDKPQLNTLVEDIKIRTKDRHQHYFGVIAIKRVINQDNIIFKIIDGQQRITTSLILLKAAYDNLKERKLKSLKILDSIFETPIIFKRYMNDSAKTGQKEELMKILTTGQGNFEWRYGKNYNYFLNYFDSLSWEKLSDFVETFINKFDIACLEYQIEPNREMDIFENMNSKGTELQEWDLIRNHIFNMISIQELLDIKKVKIMEDIFSKDFRSGFKVKKQEDELSLFMNEWIYYELTKQGKKFKEFDRFPIYNNFKLIFNEKINAIEKYNEILINFKKFGIIYKSLSLKNISLLDKIFSKVVLRWKNISSKKQMYFLIFKLFQKFGKWNREHWFFEDNQILESIKLIDTILIRMEVAKGFGHSMRNNAIQLFACFMEKKWYSQIIDLIFNSESMYVSDKNFKNTLLSGGIKKTLSSKMLQQLESFLIDKNGYGVEINFQKPSLEHVMPNSNEKWINFLKEQNNENWEEEYSECLNLLGNFYVLPQKLNSKIQNDIFKSKKEELLKIATPSIKGDNEEGIISLEKIDEWTFEVIKSRNKKIVDILC